LQAAVPESVRSTASPAAAQLARSTCRGILFTSGFRRHRWTSNQCRPACPVDRCSPSTASGCDSFRLALKPPRPTIESATSRRVSPRSMLQAVAALVVVQPAQGGNFARYGALPTAPRRTLWAPVSTPAEIPWGTRHEISSHSPRDAAHRAVADDDLSTRARGEVPQAAPA